MNTQEVAKAIIKISGLSQGEIAERCGKANAANIGMFLQSNNMRVDSLQSIVNACGYDLVVRSREGKGPEYIIGDDVASCTNGTITEEQIRNIVKEMVEKEVRKAATSARSGLSIEFPKEEDI